MPQTRRSGIARSLGVVAAFGALVAMTACTTTGSDTATPSAPGTAEITPKNTGLSRTLSCADPIGTGATLADVAQDPVATEVMAITGGAPGSATDPIQWGEGARHGGFRFAKVGVAIKVGEKFDIVVPPAWRERMRIDWGNPGYGLATTLRVPGCSSALADAEWLVYPGGFWLKAAACVPLTIETETTSYDIQIPVGRSCP